MPEKDKPAVVHGQVQATQVLPSIRLLTITAWKTWFRFTRSLPPLDIQSTFFNFYSSKQSYQSPTRRKKVAAMQKVPAKCIAKIVVSPALMRDLHQAMETNMRSWQLLIEHRRKEAEETGAK